MADRLQSCYREVNVTDWRLVGEEVLGTKPKRWRADPQTGEQWLLKDATYSRPADGTSYRKGDDWAERIATGVAERLELPAAQTELAVDTRGDETCLGVISRDMRTPEEDLLHGNELLKDPPVGRGRSGYTLEAVREALQGVRPPTGIPEAFTAWDVFVGYLVLDAVIGNTDRHEENWAVLRRGELLKLAPSFDHASSLGFLWSDSAREARLATRDRGYTVEAWAEKARSWFAGRPDVLDVAVAALEMSSSHTRSRWLDRCQDADRLVEPIWYVPSHRMSRTAGEFAERLVRHNRRRLVVG
ncbi:MAG: HipA domain-containing protein [bacterium]|nr:HipA domain-containing protein [bacterium]